MDIPLLIIGGLASIGYYINKNGRASREQVTLRNAVPDSQIPNSYHVYEGNNYTNVMADRQRRADNLNMLSRDPENTNVIPALYNLKTNPKKSKKKLLVLPPFGPSPNNVEQKKKDVKQLHRPSIDPVQAVYKTKPQEMGGFNGITRENFHNNMVPFYSGTQPKQDMRMETYGGKLERLTGVGDVMYKSKSEVGSFHQLSQNPNVFTTPALSDSMRARTNMLVDHKKQGELLHQPINVAPSTSGKPGVLGNEGFHPMYRERTRTVDDLRTGSKPKQSMDIRERVPISKGTLANGPLRPEFHQNNPLREHKLDLKYSVAGASGAKADRFQSDSSVFVPANSRTTLTQNEYTGNQSGVNRQQGYITKNVFGDFNTIRGQQGDSEYIGPMGGYEQHQVYNSDPLRRTVKETTQSDYTPNAKDDMGKGYLLVNQEAHTTARETTNSGYTGGAGGGVINTEFVSRDNVYNSEINALKSLTEHMREPTQVREKLVSGKDQINYQNFRSVRHVLNENIPKYQNSQPAGKLDDGSRRGLNTAGHKDSYANNRNQNLIMNQLSSNPYIQKDIGLQPRSSQK
jgi:hypothetical protein